MPPGISFILNFVFVLETSGWPRTMPGGVKIQIGSDILSFSTDLCSGGIFFKRPVLVDRICLHGYFLRRVNGCVQQNADIIAGENYVCLSESSVNYPMQALIPLTNPADPLAHTLTLYDHEDLLTNFRRYTYRCGLEQKYQSGATTHAKTLVVANMQNTPDVALGDFCYRGKADENGGAYIVNTDIDDTANLFGDSCSNSSSEFPWKKARRFPFTEGFTLPSKFAKEIPAALPYGRQFNSSARNNMERREIWDGRAYCLRAKVKHSRDGRERMSGLCPSLVKLEPFCAVVESFPENLTAQARSRRGATVLLELTRQKRNEEVENVSGIQKMSTFQTHNRGRTIIIVINETCPPYCIQDGSCCDGGSSGSGSSGNVPPPPPNGKMGPNGESCPPFCVNIYGNERKGDGDDATIGTPSPVVTPAPVGPSPPEDPPGDGSNADKPTDPTKPADPPKPVDPPKPAEPDPPGDPAGPSEPRPIGGDTSGSVSATLGRGQLPIGFQKANLMNCIRVCLPQPLPVRTVPMTWKAT